MIHCYVGKLGETPAGVQEIEDYLHESDTFFATAKVGESHNNLVRVIFKEESHAELFLLRFSGRD